MCRPFRPAVTLVALDHRCLKTRLRISGPSSDRRASARGSASGRSRTPPRSPCPRSKRSRVTTSRACPAASSAGRSSERTRARSASMSRTPCGGSSRDSPRHRGKRARCRTSRTRTTFRWTNRRRSAAPGAPSAGRCRSCWWSPTSDSAAGCRSGAPRPRRPRPPLWSSRRCRRPPPSHRNCQSSVLRKNLRPCLRRLCSRPLERQGPRSLRQRRRAG